MAVPKRPGRKERSAPDRSESKWSVSRLVLEKAPFLALSAAVSFVTWRLQSGGGAVWSQLPFVARCGNAAVSYIRYLEKMVWPEGLAAFYPLGEPWPWPWVMGALLLLGLITFAAALNWQRRPWLATGWFWYLGMLVPVIGLVQVGMQSMADRYTYLPLIGVFIALVWGVGEYVASVRLPMAIVAFVTVAILLSCMVVTRLQLGYWNNSETLYRHMLAVTKNNYAAEYDLGETCYAQGKLDEAGRHYAEAVRLAPEWANARNNLGTVLLRLGHYTEAVSQFQEAVRLKPTFLGELNLAKALVVAGRPDEACPEFEKALQLEPASAEAQRAYGQTLAALKRTDLAVEHYEAALKLQPDQEKVEFELGNLLANNGHVEAALGHFRAAIRLNPDQAEAYNGLGFCFSLQRKWADAAQNFSRALELKPTLWLAVKNLALVDMAQHKWDEAIPLLRRSLELKPGDALVHTRLGQCLEQTGEPAEAEDQFQQALQLDPGNAQAQAGLAALRASQDRQAVPYSNTKGSP
jgi:tetratricopeptide (TPR) repeat protein